MNQLAKRIGLSSLAFVLLIGLFRALPPKSIEKFPALTVNKGETLLNQPPGDPYEKDWARLKQLEEKGSSQDAAKLVDSLYEVIKKDKNYTQFYKVSMLKATYITRLNEDGFKLALKVFQAGYQESPAPIKQLFASAIAEQLAEYLSLNQWKFSNRTAVSGDVNLDDIDTWDLERIHQQIVLQYQLSLTNTELLKKEQLSDYADIIEKGENTERLRPTLYDLLANRALDYLRDEKNYLNAPVYKFYIDQPVALGKAADFVQYKFTSKDTSSDKFKTLLLFQELLSFRLTQQAKDATALVDIDIKRLEFVKGNAVVDGKNDLYRQELERLLEVNKDAPIATEISWRLASYHREQAQSRKKAGKDAKADPLKWENKVAKEICEAAIKKFPKSYGAVQCANILNSILSKSLSLEAEKVNEPNKPILAKISYQNINKVWLRMIPITADIEQKLQKREDGKEEKFRAYLNGLPAIKTWSVNVPNDDDYYMHTTEINLESCSTGNYLLLACSDANIKSVSGLSYMTIHVSNIAYFTRKNKNEQEFVVTDRSAGSPLKNVTAEVYQYEYNYNSRAYNYTLVDSKKADEQGVVLINKKYKNSYAIKFIHGLDVLFLKDSYYNYDNGDYDYSHDHVKFFLDRGIYRPGQTIYFKGLSYHQGMDAKSFDILKGKAHHLELYNTNYQKVSELDLVSNDFGTFNGSFNAPSTGLTGQMNILDTQTGERIYFRVEEYKRPKFEANFKPVTGAYQLGDKVKVIGEGKAYAGNAIDGAKVKYRVLRKAEFPYWHWWMWGWNIPWSTEEQEIVFGETTSDGEGKFEINFDALADRSIPKEQKPAFHYTIEADVTDVAGETHVCKTTINVGYVSMNMAAILPEDNMIADSLRKIGIRTVNLNGEAISILGNIRVEKLKTPTVTYRKRFWELPTDQVLSAEEFKKHFPNYSYANEDEPVNWATEETVANNEFNTEKSTAFELPKKLSAGVYRLMLTAKDKSGEEVQIMKIFSLYQPNADKLADNSSLMVSLPRDEFEPGSTAVLQFGSAAKNAWIYYEIEHQGKIISSKWIKTNGIVSESIPILEAYRGNISYHFSMINDNRFYNKDGEITVPWSNKDLKFEYQTFRDKLLPGQDEEWRIKISGNNKDKIVAEMVAAMYDASLDVFQANNWNFSLYQRYWSNLSFNANAAFQANYGNQLTINWNRYESESVNKSYPKLNMFNFALDDYRYRYKGNGRRAYRDGAKALGVAAAPAAGKKYKTAAKPAKTTKNAESKEDEKEKAKLEESDGDGVADHEVEPQDLNPFRGVEKDKSKGKDKADEVKVRTNLKETVFFYPNLMTDSAGNVVIKFKMNEALTKWKFLGFAHTQDLKLGFTTKTIVTQKDLMITPNLPRFLRENDQIELTAKVANLTNSELSGEATLELLDALTMKPINVPLGNMNKTVSFTAKAGQSAPVSWKIKLPDHTLNGVTIRMIAKSGIFSDGEENTLPVVTNSMLVTETQPMSVRGGQSKTFEFKRMKELSSSKTLRNHKLTLEFTPNPAWYAIQSLPYLMEYPYECTEQIFSRFYANSLASEIANSHPKIKAVFEAWKNTPALESNLAKNQELKTALLEETPWVLQAQSEEQQKKNIGLLFDLNKMSRELDQAADKLIKRQTSNGGFAWFTGGRDDEYITQYLCEGIGHLDRLGVKVFSTYPKMESTMQQAVSYCDKRAFETYEWIKKHDKLEDNHLGYMAIHYLYMRSFYGANNALRVSLSSNAKTVRDYYLGQAEKYWNTQDIYAKGMLALIAHREGKKALAETILNAIKQNALNSEEMGMYWKYDSGYYWYQMPIETHALLIEVFDEVAQDAASVDAMKVWLLKTRQTTHWATTKGTASACYALLLRGDNWLMEDQPIDISMGGKPLDQSKIAKEAGTGYFKTSWEGDAIKPEMGTMVVKNPNKNPAWGALYWQYFEQLDKITWFKETPLKLKKDLYKQVNTDKGLQLVPITEKDELHVGDLVKVRIELRTDRDMEYIHLKDMRASCFEPTTTLSSYEYQGGMGYYQSTRDLNTSFFMGYLSKGTYVFEYPLRVTHKGTFSNGITTIQSMYAPEFTSHSQGIIITVK